jgi:hypothetical protein
VDDAGGVDAVGACLCHERVAGAVPAHHPHQRDRQAELREGDRLVGSLAAQDFLPGAHSGGGARPGHLRDPEHEVARDLTDDDDFRGRSGRVKRRASG